MGSGAFPSPKMHGPPLDALVRSFGPRRRNKGVMGTLVRVPPYTSRAGTKKRHKASVRSQTGSTRPTAAGFECGQDKPYASAHIPGKFKVMLPKNRVRVP